MEISFLTLAEILEIHSNQIELYGGATGIRNQGLLEAAIAQPEAQFDGNKRVGAVSATIFLEINNYELDVSENLLEETVIATASGELKKEDLFQFFKHNTKKL